LFEAPLRLKPKSGRFSVSATALFGELDETASAVDGRWMDIDQAIALQEAKHLPHRGPFDIEPFGKSVHRDISRFAKRRQGKELSNAQARWPEMGIIESRDLPSGLPRSKTIALIDPKRLIDRHLFALSFPVRAALNTPDNDPRQSLPTGPNSCAGQFV
jgi:hypothetical protein